MRSLPVSLRESHVAASRLPEARTENAEKAGQGILGSFIDGVHPTVAAISACSSMFVVVRSDSARRLTTMSNIAVHTPFAPYAIVVAANLRNLLHLFSLHASFELQSSPVGNVCGDGFSEVDHQANLRRKSVLARLGFRVPILKDELVWLFESHRPLQRSRSLQPKHPGKRHQFERRGNFVLDAAPKRPRPVAIRSNAKRVTSRTSLLLLRLWEPSRRIRKTRSFC